MGLAMGVSMIQWPVVGSLFGYHRLKHPYNPKQTNKQKKDQTLLLTVVVSATLGLLNDVGSEFLYDGCLLVESCERSRL